MTTSLRALTRCLGLTGPVSVSRDIVDRAERNHGGRRGLGRLTGPVSLARVMRHLDWQWCGGAPYLKAAVPPELRSPSGEEAQIAVEGIAERITLFMGKSDWELDWHLYPRLDPATTARVAEAGRLRSGRLFCEWMAVDRWKREILGRQWWSSDMDGVLRLKWPLPHPKNGADTASIHWSLVEDSHQGGHGEEVADITNPATCENSALIGGRVYLQGAFVVDDPGDHDGHDHLEIHPLDSIAYALDERNAVLTARGGRPGWPRTTVTWRVATMANAGFHRINDCGFMSHPRTTVWYLDLPSNAAGPGAGVRVSASDPGFHVFPSGQRRRRRGVDRVEVTPPADGQRRPVSSFPTDPRDGRRKLRVTVTMAVPDDWGGLSLTDYHVATDDGTTPPGEGDPR